MSKVRVGISTEVSAYSEFQAGMSDIDTSLYYPWTGNQKEAVTRARGLMKDSLSFVNVHLMAWGVSDPWSDPKRKEPYDWETLDAKLKSVVAMGATPVITLCEAPWWMKGRLNSDGSTTLLKAEDDYADIAYNSRILDNRMGDWLHLVKRVAERYMAAPYNVRYFQVWNEFKGYYNPIRNNWDVGNTAGDPKGAHAKHGYTYMYNRVYQQLKSVAVAKKLNVGSVKVGGPYIVMDTWGEAPSREKSALVKTYGTYDIRTLEAIKYWLRYKVGAEFITIDGANINRDNNRKSDAFSAAEKFAHVVYWLRSLNSYIYRGADTLPIWFAEWYAQSEEKYRSQDNVLKAYAMMRFIRAGGAVALAWGGEDLWTGTGLKDGGKPYPWYVTYKLLNKYFGKGTALYDTVVSSVNCEALASDRHVLLVNKSKETLLVDIGNEHIVLEPYQVRMVERSDI